MYTKRKANKCKIIKGDAGYIAKRKKQVICKTIFEFGIVAALLILGITQTGDRMNVLTIVAILGCLPASKALVEVIMISPHRSIANDKVHDVEAKANSLTKVYDMVFTSEKKVMPIECIVIADHTICGYTSSTKLDVAETEKHLKQYTKASVKIYKDYNKFLSRAEDMNHMESSDNSGIKNMLLNLSL